MNSTHEPEPVREEPASRLILDDEQDESLLQTIAELLCAPVLAGIEVTLIGG